VLENSELGKSPSPLTGLEADQKELVFAAGLEGVEKDKHKDVDELILNCLNELVTNGIDKDLIDSSLHQLEIKQREITGSGMPFGLQIMLSCLPACIHNDDPLGILDLDSAFNTIKSNLQSGRYVEDLIEKHLIKNNHRLNYSLIPDVNFNKKTEERIQKKVSEKTKNFTTEEKNNIVKLATSLQKRQESHDDPEILPKVTKEDIPKERKYPSPFISHSNNGSNYYYKSGTNGIVYHSMLFPCDALNNNELAVASLFSNSITDIGLGNDSYESIQKYQSSVTGGISSSFVMLPCVDNKNYKLALKLSGKSLEKNDLLMQELMLRTIEDSKFDEPQRIKELLDFISSDNEKSLIQNGHVLAMNNAASQINSIAATNDLTSGIRFINNTSNLSKTISDKDNLEQYIETLKSIKAKISHTPNYLFTATSLEKNNLKLLTEFKSSSCELNNQELYSIQKDSIGWITGSQVCFCSEAFATVDSKHEDAPALTVLGAVLRNGYLHSAIREKGGAYGSGASQDSYNRVFKFFSYRDPKCSETFSEFKKSREWSLKNITPAQLDEGVLGVISSIDKPLSPYGEAMSDFMSELDHKKQSERLAFRSKVKECSIDDLVKVSEKYLFSDSKSAVIAGEPFESEIKNLDFKLKNI
jgi:Zn-dependent M16 (insulinase) family peptidase